MSAPATITPEAAQALYAAAKSYLDACNNRQISSAIDALEAAVDLAEKPAERRHLGVIPRFCGKCGAAPSAGEVCECLAEGRAA